MCQFVATLAKTDKTPKAIKELVDEAFQTDSQELTLSLSQIYNIVKSVRKDGRKARIVGQDKRGTATTRLIRTPQLIAAVKTFVEADRRVTMREIAARNWRTGELAHSIISHLAWVRQVVVAIKVVHDDESLFGYQYQLK